MKKFLSIMSFLVLMIAMSASAQGIYLDHAIASDTSTNQDTSYVVLTATRGTVKAAQVTVTKVSGTQHGTVVIDGSIDGNWIPTSDTMTLTDQDVNTKIFTSPGIYFRYRARYITPSGTQQSILKFSLLRQDEQ